MKYIKRRYRTWLLVLLITTLAIVPTFILSMQIRQINKQQTDTLNTLMSVYRLTDDYSEENGVVDKLLDKSEKVGTIVDYELIEGVVAAEARGDTLDGMIAVAQTIKDRGDLWEMSYTEVVLSPGQYADPYTGVISDKVKLAVELVFDYGYRISEEPITHFCTTEIADTITWTEAKICRGMLNSDNHLFYY